MIAGGKIPTWAAGLAIMSTYVSSISYIATPGKAYDDNWHPLIFALAIFPVAWFTNRYAIPYYRKAHLIRFTVSWSKSWAAGPGSTPRWLFCSIRSGAWR